MKVDHLVADSGAFFRSAVLQDLGTKLYTCREVVKEIRDKRSRRRHAVLPYELEIKDPSPSSVTKIVEVSKVTGDYASLSSTDIKVLALTYELTCLHEGKDVVNENVDIKNQIQVGGDDPTDLPGFYMPSRNGVEKEEDVCHSDDEERTKELVINLKKIDINQNPEEVANELRLQDMTLKDNEDEEKDNDDTESDVVADEGDGGGWITPAMLREMRNDKLTKEEPGKEVKVACITTDFAMQNVLLKMSLHIVAVDGMLIKSLRSYVLRCHACFEITKIMTKVFCPKCGNKTLKRVPVQIQPDSTMKLFFSRNPKVLSHRGLKYSLPKPQGGKHSHNPILVEDQNMPQDRPSRKAMMKTNVWSEDYNPAVSPFVLNDTESRAFHVGNRAGNYSRWGGNRNANSYGNKRR